MKIKTPVNKKTGFFQKAITKKNQIIYQATIAGTITNNLNSKNVFSRDRCEITFEASTCKIKTQECNGI